MAPPAERPATKTRSRSIGWRAITSSTSATIVGRLAAVARLMFLEEPIPAALRIRAYRLFGIDDVRADPFGNRVEARPGGEIARGLRASVQRDDQRRGGPRAYATDSVRRADG